jgi:alkylation response protein AidB-like acyl-CoA dehydrogenase
MDFSLNDDQRAFAESARALFEDHCGEAQLRAHDSSGDSYLRALWPACIELGLHGVLVPEHHGGLGLGMAELMGVLQAQGQALALVPLWEHQLAAAAVARFGAATLAQRVLPAAMDGTAMITVSLDALSEPRGAGLVLSRGSASGWQLDGTVAAVPLGGDARFALLAAACDDQPRLLLLDLWSAGVQRRSGLSQHRLGVADLLMECVALPDDAVLDAAAHGWAEPRAIACLAALQLGVSAEQARRTVQYVSEREQFGRVIGSFQLVAGQMADIHIGIETLRSTLWQLVYRLDAGLGAMPQALALRAQACDLAHFAGHKCQHLHGGMGVDVTYPIHRFLYWSRALSTTLGGRDLHLQRLGDWLADHDRLGWKYDLPEDTPL